MSTAENHDPRQRSSQPGRHCALARLAVTRARNADPDNRLAQRLDEIIAAGLSPREVTAILAH